jgi:hypothetical protein
MSEFFTRLTSNFNDWKKPSGTVGKCSGVNPLYEETHGFGWEEWLFEEYNQNKSNPDHVCHGFVQALNKINGDKKFIGRLYLYTKVCNNKNGIEPGLYYLGYIDNVKRIDPIPKLLVDVRAYLIKVDLHDSVFIPMLPFAQNISFKVKDVHVHFPLVYAQPIQLKRGQFRFSLYDLNNHPNFLSEINNYL